ncbi:prepilin peptidase [candidate division KSB1 bacterium]|nr:prepilin peptidase [candidate division KSB1 bacterium]
MKLFITILTVGILLVVSYYDLKWRRIPNFLTLPAIAVGLLSNLIYLGFDGFKSSAFGFLLGGGIFLLLYILRAMGAGDVKLMAAVGALVGLRTMPSVLVLTVFAGGLLAVAKMSKNLFDHYIKDPSQKKNGSSRPKEIKKTLFLGTIPYGVAISIGTIISLFSNYWN